MWAVETDRGRALITNQIEAPRLANDFDLASLGWDLIGVPWFDADAALEAAASFCGQSRDNFLSDVDGIGENILNHVIAERMVLTEPEQDDLRNLGALVGYALGAGISSWQPGVSTDFEIASVVSAELERHGAKAVCLIVGGDERLRSLRHPLSIGETLHEAVMAVVVARRGGLHAAATRIALRDDDEHLRQLMGELDDVHRVVLDASRPGHTWGEAADALAEGYAAIGRPDTWREHFQGGPIAFEQREFELAPGQSSSPFWNLPCRSGTAVAWNPSAHGGAKIEETYLVSDTGFELITATDDWPLTPVSDGPQHGQVKVVQ